MKKIKHFLLSVGAITLLAGCSSKAPIASGEPSLNEIDVMLEEGISKIEKKKADWKSLLRGNEFALDKGDKLKDTVANYGEKDLSGSAALKQAETEKGASYSVTSNPLDKRVNISWKGDANQVLKTLALKIGFQYEQVGVKKNIPVNFKAKNETVKDVLTDLTSKVSSKMDIKVSTANKTITAIYK